MWAKLCVTTDRHQCWSSGQGCRLLAEIYQSSGDKVLFWGRFGKRASDLGGNFFGAFPRNETGASGVPALAGGQGSARYQLTCDYFDLASSRRCFHLSDLIWLNLRTEMNKLAMLMCILRTLKKERILHSLVHHMALSFVLLQWSACVMREWSTILVWPLN